MNHITFAEHGPRLVHSSRGAGGSRQAATRRAHWSHAATRRAESIGLVADGPVKVAGRASYFILCSDESFRRIVEGDMNMDDEGLGVL